MGTVVSVTWPRWRKLHPRAAALLSLLIGILSGIVAYGVWAIFNGWWLP